MPFSHLVTKGNQCLISFTHHTLTNILSITSMRFSSVLHNKLILKTANEKRKNINLFSLLGIWTQIARFWARWHTNVPPWLDSISNNLCNTGHLNSGLSRVQGPIPGLRFIKLYFSTYNPTLSTFSAIKDKNWFSKFWRYQNVTGPFKRRKKERDNGHNTMPSN